jgi:hypothetical protein
MGKRGRKGSDDPIGDYVEWSNNRYNPGYWLGRRVPSDVKNLWSPKDRRWMGAVLLSPFIIALVVVTTQGLKYTDDDLILTMLGSAPFVLFGLFLLLAPSGNKKRRKPEA